MVNYLYFHKLEKAGLARIVWVTSAFFRQGKSVPLLLPCQTSMYFDDDHLSHSGAIYLLKHIQGPLKDAIISPCESWIPRANSATLNLLALAGRRRK
ncbi:MAG: hypothetical protein IJE88_08150 [Akkermansia sp.]|nr:hypothetical protein [Akkermansia sp.]